MATTGAPLCTQIDQLLGPGSCSGWPHIKEKFASLRLYFSFAPRDADGEALPHSLTPDVRRLVDAAADRADKPCEECESRRELGSTLAWQRRPEMWIGVEFDPAEWPDGMPVVGDELHGIAEPSVRDAPADKLAFMGERVATIVRRGREP